MAARINTVAFHKVDVQNVDVQVQISNRLPAFTDVGLIKPDRIWAYKTTLSVIAFLLCLLSALPVIASEAQPITPDIAAVLGLAMSEDKQPFEDKIRELLFVTTDDIHRSGFGEREVDIQERKSYFTNQGWNDYQDFLLALKTTLKEKSTQPLNAKAEFLYGSQSYQENSEKTANFQAKGHIYYAQYDAYDPIKEFEISISYSIDDMKTVSGLLIDKWDVKFHDLSKGLE